MRILLVDNTPWRAVWAQQLQQTTGAVDVEILEANGREEVAKLSPDILASLDAIVWGDYLGARPCTLSDWTGGPRWARAQGCRGRMVAASDDPETRKTQVEDGCAADAGYWESDECMYERAVKEGVLLCLDLSL